jgi:hypothetical protein
VEVAALEAARQTRAALHGAEPERVQVLAREAVAREAVA